MVTPDEFASLAERLRKIGATRVVAGDLLAEFVPQTPDVARTPASLVPIEVARERALSKSERTRLAELEEKLRMEESLP